MGLSFTSADDELRDDKLKEALEHLVTKFVKERKLELSKDKLDNIVDSMFKAIKENKETLTRGQLFNPAFIKKLTLALNMAAMDKTNKVDEIFEKVFKLFKDKNIDKEKLLKMSPDQFNKFVKENFTAEEKLKLASALKELAQEVAKNAEKTGDLQLKPGANLKPLQDNLAANLYNLMNQYITGSERVYSFQDLGPGIFTDYNPNPGDAPGDRATKLDYALGDPLGLEEATRQAYLAQPDTITDQFIISEKKPETEPFSVEAALEEGGIKPPGVAKTPSLTPGGEG